MSGTPRVPANDRIARLETEMLPPHRASALPKAYRIGPYEIDGIIGKGGMGVVYRAKVVESCPVPLDQVVALKMLSEQNLDELDRRRFEREAAYLQALRHPGIVRILDLGEHEGRPFLVMQLVEGKTLDEVLQHRMRQERLMHLAAEESADILVQGLEALHVAHIAGILHRDLKPGNLMITPQGGIKILDFGMARRISAEHSRLTASGSVLGTPAYMPPEQAAGARDLLGPRTDIYSMGAVCYELTTGCQPFTADTSLAVLRRILDEDLTPPSVHNPTIPRDLETIILKAMAKDTRDRYPSAEEMAQDLRQFRAGRRIRARRLGTMKPLMRKLWANRSLVTAVSLGLFITAVLVALLARQVKHHMEGREVEIQEQVRSELTEMLQPKWLTAWEHNGLLDWVSVKPHTQTHPLFPELQVLTLPSVSSNVALGLDVAPLDNALLELLIADRSIGDGYALRYERADGSGELQLLRGSADDTGRRTEIGHVSLDLVRPFRLSLVREDDLITARVDDREVIRFPDLAPIEGLENDKVSLAMRPESVRLANIVLERQRPPEKVSRLVAIDMVRQQGRYDRAMTMYREFLRDFPDSEDSRSAHYRIGLCQEKLGRYDDALDTFAELSRQSEDNPRYFINSTFHAWSTALKLARYDEADGYFDSIRRRFDLRQLLAAVPFDTLASLPMDYIKRAREAEDPERAHSLYLTAVDIASYLEKWSLMPLGLLGAGDVTLAEGRVAEAIEYYRQVANDERFATSDQHLAQLKTGEAERLRFRFSESQDAYQLVIDDSTRGEAQWARLWLGDLLLYLGDREAAIRVWRSSTEPVTRPGKLMAHLVQASDPLPVGDDPFFANDIEYFNAVLSLLEGNELSYRERLENVIAMSEPHDWPASLARQIVSELEHYPPYPAPDGERFQDGP
ncbi:MAG: protein kinase [Planctomycetota bacterium]|jgi:serine/threonine protein kinase/tetratricopeptide (TPR) repeat protein|nr:protein kinase [Planctomycetota bacterium]